MTKRNGKRTPAEKAPKLEWRQDHETVFLNGRMKHLRRSEPLINGIPADEFIRRNADPVWLLQSEMHDIVYQLEREQEKQENSQQDLAAYAGNQRR